MRNLDNIIITDIGVPAIVHSKRGRKYHMDNRATFALSLCTSGQITYTMGDKTYVSTPDCAIVLPQGGTYSLVGDKEGFFPVVNFCAENFSCDEILVLPLENPQACLQIFESLRTFCLRGGNRLKIYSLFYELISKIASDHTRKRPMLHIATAYIEEHISQTDLSVPAIAKEINISEVYLRKLFCANMHMSPKQYILDLRIKKAKQLLLDTPYSITTIAEECGFTSLYHFCRVFKQRTGITPTQYAVENRIYKI